MSIEKQRKLNHLLSGWADGEVRTSQQLHALGYGSEYLQKYKGGQWIEPVGRGAYKKYGDVVDWTSAVACLQKEDPYSFYVGGKLALELLGKGQYLVFDRKEVTLFSNEKKWMPSWLNADSLGVQIKYQRKDLFDLPQKQLGFTDKAIEKNKIVMATAERAYLEYLDDVPQRYSYSEAVELLENLPTLRPKLMQELLETCRSIKVKRLFLYLSEKVNHSWASKIQTRNVHLGDGKRVVFKNGVLNKKYNITVPKEELDENSIP